nr:hypothetical protein 5 [bacterium]
MADTVVNIQVKTTGQQKLEQFAKSASKTDRELSKLNPKLNQTATATARAGKAAATATGNIQRMGIAFRTTVAPIVAAYGALNFFSKAVGVAGDRQADINLLANGLKRLGAGADELQKLQRQANDFGNATLFNQEDFIKGAGVLTSFTSVAVSEYQRLIKVAGDLAQTNGTDVRSSLLQVAKAVNAPVEGITALTRSGVQFTKQQKEIVKALVATGRTAEAQEMILRELENQYKGNATAAATGLAGAQDSLGEAFRDFQEVVGKGVIPVVTEFITGLTGLFQKLSTIDPKVIESGTRAAVFAGKVLLVSKALKGLIALKAGVTGMLAASATKMAAAGTAAGTAAPKVRALAGALKTLAAIGIVTVGVEYITKGLQSGAAIEDVTKRLEAGGSGATFTGATRETVVKAQQTAKQTVNAVNAELERLKPNPWLNAIPGLGPALAGQRGARAQQLQLRKADAQTVLDLDPSKFESQAERTARQIADQQEAIRKALQETQKTGGSGSSGSGSASKAADEAERQAEAIREGLLSSQESLDVMRQELKVSEAASELMAQQEQLQLSRLQINQDYDSRMREALKNNLSEQQKINIELERGLALRKASIDAQEGMLDAAQGEFTTFFQKQPEAANLLNDELTETEQLLNSAYTTIAGDLTNGIKGLISGTKDWQDILGDVLNSLSSILLQFGTKMLGVSLGIPGFASGGTIQPNSLAVVGEKGPELVRSGNAPMEVFSNERSQQMVNRAQSDFMPGINGGFSSPSVSANINYSGPQLTFDGSEYIPKAALPDIVRESAKQGAVMGEARVMSSLKNNRSARTRIGI